MGCHPMNNEAESIEQLNAAGASESTCMDLDDTQTIHLPPSSHLQSDGPDRVSGDVPSRVVGASDVVWMHEPTTLDRSMKAIRRIVTAYLRENNILDIPTPAEIFTISRRVEAKMFAPHTTPDGFAQVVRGVTRSVLDVRPRDTNVADMAFHAANVCARSKYSLLSLSRSA